MNEDNTFVPPMQQAAAGIHETFITYVHAGFTRDEALRIVIAQMGWFAAQGDTG